MPTSAESSRFMRTYTADAGSSPTRMVASPGVRPMAATSRLTSSRTFAATAAKLRVPHIVAGGERGTPAGSAAGLGDRCAAAPGGRRGGPSRRLLVAVGELDRDLVDEAAAQVPVPPAEEHAGPRVREVELALRACDSHVGEPPLLLEVARLDRPHVREDAVL